MSDLGRPLSGKRDTVSSPLRDGAREAYHAMDPAEVVRRLEVDPARGLSQDEVTRRRARHGENRLAGDAGIHPLVLLGRQFTDLMVVVLLVAAAVAGLIGEAMDAIAIMVIVALNAIIGFIQEYRAERALAALQAMSAPQVQVLRAGQNERIPEAAVVPGDIVLLEAGNVVPADLRVLETADLTVDEAALTGESVPGVKDAEARLAPDTPLGERATMVHKGTHVTSGRARCVAVATGAATELGRIAGLMRGRERPTTPLQRRLARFGRRLFGAVLVICAVIFVAGLLRGESPLLMLLTAVSLAVAAIPEALPAVVTIGLALGAKRMAGRNALVRRLPAVETLGSVTVICCDKTGTLTQNAMRAERFLTPAGQAGELSAAGDASEVWRTLGRAIALNNDARADHGGKIQGDPTEVALLEAAQGAGFARAELEQHWARIADIAFDARRRRMTTLHRGRNAALRSSKAPPRRFCPSVGTSGAAAASSGWTATPCCGWRGRPPRAGTGCSRSPSASWTFCPRPRARKRSSAISPTSGWWRSPPAPARVSGWP